MRFLTIVLLSLVIIGVYIAPGQAAFFPLEITNIKPAGNGNPAIPATNRIFRAYPGIEYHIRAAVIGGEYPYTYALSNAPVGMTINSRTGEITWTNPQANSGTITLSVTDSESTTATTSWTIDVATSGFHFVDASYSGTETGSIDQPYSSLANFLTATYNGNGSDIVYFKSGTYQMVYWNADKPDRLNIQNNPRNWLAYPGHTVTLQGGTEAGQASGLVVWGGDFYFDGLVVKDTIGYSIFTSSKYFYKTIRRCKFTGLVPPDNTNNNYGFIHITSSTQGYGLVIQDNEFTRWRESSAIGSIYNESKLLIENNYIHTPLPAGTPVGIGQPNGISLKVGNHITTIRGNKIVMDRGFLLAGHNGMFYSENGTEKWHEICFNLTVSTSSATNLFDWEVDNQYDTMVWRNTLISRIGSRTSTAGPHTITNNIIINDGQPIEGGKSVYDYYSYQTGTDLSDHTTYDSNLTGSDASTIVDHANNYKLTPAQSAYVGFRGWQFADGSTPMDGIGSPHRLFRNVRLHTEVEP